MPISEICNREVVIVQRHNTILEAAQLMRQHHVGDVVVIEERGGVRVPVGIVTDRDLVVEIMAPAIDQTVITVGDIMVTELATVKENAGLSETIEYMRAKGCGACRWSIEAAAWLAFLRWMTCWNFSRKNYWRSPSW
jgi:CBS domain-containing protein